MLRPSSINPKIISTRNILVMAHDELCTSLGVATKMPQMYLNTPSPRSGFHPRQHINSFMTKVLLTAIHCWTLHREWSHSSFIFFNKKCRYHHATVSFIHGCHLMLKNLLWKISIKTLSIWMNTPLRPSFTIAAYQWVRSIWNFDSLILEYLMIAYSCGSLESP